MKFLEAFDKTAASGKGFQRALEGAKSILKKTRDVGAGAASGVSQALDTPLRKHLNPMHAVEQVADAAKKNRGFIQAFKSQKGRKAMGEAAGRSLPAAAATAGYAYAGKKLYDKTLGNRENEYAQGGYYL